MAPIAESQEPRQLRECAQAARAGTDRTRAPSASSSSRDGQRTPPAPRAKAGTGPTHAARAQDPGAAVRVVPKQRRTSVECELFSERFFGVGPREEICKFIAFLGITLGFKKIKTHPVATMYYMGIVGLGFAMFENLHYVFRYGTDVLYTRTFTSTLAHMIFSMFLGYWLGLSKVDNRQYGNRSIFGFYMFKYKKLKTLIYTIIGLLCAATFHGLWNFNLSNWGPSTIPIMILMLVLGMTTCKFAATDLYNHHRKSLKNKV